MLTEFPWETQTADALRSEMEIECQTNFDNEQQSGMWLPVTEGLKDSFVRQIRELIGDLTGRGKSVHYWVYLGKQYSDCTIIYRARIRQAQD